MNKARAKRPGASARHNHLDCMREKLGLYVYNLFGTCLNGCRVFYILVHAGSSWKRGRKVRSKAPISQKASIMVASTEE